MTEELSRQQDCVNTVLDFFYFLDAGDGDGTAALFTCDGVWLRNGNALRGPDEIRGAVEGRPAGRKTAHLVSNVRVETVSADLARVRFYLAAYEGIEGGAPMRLAGIRRCVDVLMCRDGRWKLTSKTSERVLPLSAGA
jgi:ketosteroid isomerase-like protein